MHPLALDRFKALAKAGAAPPDALLVTSTLGGILRKAIDVENRTAEVVISTGVVDRSNDQLDPAGWDLTEYMDNPVVLADHYHAVEGIIGKALRIGIVGNQLRALDQFATRDENPYADTCFKLIAGGYARGVSPGFRYKSGEYVYDPETNGIISKGQTLFEHSIVVLPDNQQALVGAKSAGIDLDPLQAWTERFLDEWTDDAAVYVPREMAEGVYKALAGTSAQVPRGKKQTKAQKAACMQTTVWLDDEPTPSTGMQATAAADDATKTADDDSMTEDDMKELTAALKDCTVALKVYTATRATREPAPDPTAAKAALDEYDALLVKALAGGKDATAALPAALEKAMDAAAPQTVEVRLPPEEVQKVLDAIKAEQTAAAAATETKAAEDAAALATKAADDEAAEVTALIEKDQGEAFLTALTPKMQTLIVGLVDQKFGAALTTITGRVAD